MVSSSASSSSSPSSRSGAPDSRGTTDSEGSTRIISGGVGSDSEQDTGVFPAARAQSNSATSTSPKTDDGKQFSLASLRTVSHVTATRFLLVAMLAAAVALIAYKYTSDGIESRQAENAQQTSTVEAPQETKSQDKAADDDNPMPFTTADRGSCLTWDVAEDGTISHFEQADCAGPHRFEVAQREDLATYPTSEFGPEADMPNQTRQAQLREELCGAATVRYLDGRYDPTGRYSIAPILPPAPAWERGDRTMLCGLQETDRAGEPILTSGRVSEQDQARAYDPGQCVTIDSSNTLTPVDCAEPHHLEITQRVDLAPVFPDHTPSIEEQDAHLGDVCTTAAQDYMGGEENLYRVALQPFWTTQKPAAWDGGSRTVNCALVFSRGDGQFADLVGTATGGRDQLRIDGLAPPERPDRQPLRNPQ